MATIDETRSDLAKLCESLDNKRLLQAMRRAMLAEARKLRKATREGLEESKIHNAREIAARMRGGAMRNMDGYYVSATFRTGKRGRNGMHKNSRGLEKPVAFWWLQGTEERKSRGNSRGGWFARKSRRGRITPHDYMRGADAEARRSEQRIAIEFEKAVRKIAERSMRR